MGHRRVRSPFALRGAVLAAAGVALGVTATGLAVDVAATPEFPTSVSADLTPTATQPFGGTARRGHPKHASARLV